MAHPTTKLERRQKYERKYWRLRPHVFGWNMANRYVPIDWAKRDPLVSGEYPYFTYIAEASSSQRKQYLKTQVHRAVRRYKGSIPKGNWRNKIKDYWWNLL